MMSTATEELRDLIADQLVNQRATDTPMFRLAYRYLTREGAWEGCPVCGDQYCTANHTNLDDPGWQIQRAHDNGDHHYCSVNCDDRRSMLLDTAR